MVLSLGGYGVEGGHTLGWWVGVAAGLCSHPSALHGWLLRQLLPPYTSFSLCFLPLSLGSDALNMLISQAGLFRNPPPILPSTSFCRELPLHMATLYSFQSNPQTRVIPTF